MMKVVKDSKGNLGCDISYYQGDVDFVKMKKAGIKFVIIRAGFGQTVDKRFVSYINATIKAGLKVGIYWFIYASDKYISKLNAIKLIAIIEPYKDKLTCGVWADWEYDSDKVAGKLSVSQRCEIVEAFLNELTSKGYEAGIYSNQDYIKSGKFTSELIASYPLWFAKYSNIIGEYSKKGKDGQAYMWQYTSSGKGSQYGVSSKNLDMDYAYFTDVNVDTTTVLDKVQTDNKVIKASDNPWTEPTRVIFYQQGKYIMHGDDVKWVQWNLWRFGLLLDNDGKPDAKQIDGYWGPGSQKAFEEAQERLGLKTDGKCGPKSIKKFKEI